MFSASISVFPSSTGSKEVRNVTIGQKQGNGEKAGWADEDMDPKEYSKEQRMDGRRDGSMGGTDSKFYMNEQRMDGRREGWTDGCGLAAE